MKAINEASGKGWHLYHGDSCEVMPWLPESSIGLSIHSPPYMQLYSYSTSPRDLSNSRDGETFWEHYRFIISELLRLTKPGRIAAVDLMNVPAMLVRDGFKGLKDMRGRVVAEYERAGFVWHSEHCIFKDPLLEAVRTKAYGLAHGIMVKDSANSRAGLPQYLLAFKKPGENAEPIAHEDGLAWYGEDPPTTGNLSHERWRRYASPVWMDIDFTRTLNAAAARAEDDERHICPMALDIIDRAIELWSNPGDIVHDPFNGIGSTGHCALRAKRRYVGIELKDSYFMQSTKNLHEASEDKQQDLFAALAEAGE